MSRNLNGSIEERDKHVADTLKDLVLTSVNLTAKQKEILKEAIETLENKKEA